MKKIPIKILVGCCLLVMFGTLPSVAQKEGEEVTVRITKDIDGETKSYEKTYANEDEMRKDEELKAFMGKESSYHIWSSEDSPGHKIVELDQLNKSGDQFFFQFGDDEKKDVRFGFFNQGDSGRVNMEEFAERIKDSIEDFDIDVLEQLENLKDLDLVIDFQGSDDFNFVWGGDSSSNEIHVLVEELKDQAHKFRKEIEVIVVKKVRISEDVKEFGKKGRVKDSELLELDVSYYPNPAPNGRFKLRFDVPDPAPLMLRIYNLDGKEVYQRYYEGYSGLFSETIDLSKQKEGIYLLEIQVGSSRLTRKIAIDQ